jgi:type VI secretion system protein ImpF
MPDRAGATISTVQLQDLRAEVKRVIEDFEPRIDKKSLEVHLVEQATGSFNRIAFEIQAEVLAEPLPIPLLLRTDFSLETGLCELHESDGRD